MKMNRLGRTEMMVSEICLGTMTWGEQNTEADAHEQMDYALAQGVNFFDTAEMYPTQPTRAETQGLTEEYIGSWFRASGKRNEVVLATKMGGAGVSWIRNGEGFTRSSVMQAVDGNLKRLQWTISISTSCTGPTVAPTISASTGHLTPASRTRQAQVDDIRETLEGLA
jgi:aryl-alcohol dehydrogenase-like predicted oxidoreductase